MLDLAERIDRPGAGSCSATGEGSCARRAPRRTTSWTTRPAAARSSPRHGPSSATIPGSRSTRGCAARWSGTPTTRPRLGGLMRVSVIGTGYVGLVSGVCLAESGHEVVCVDVDPAKVASIRRACRPSTRKGSRRCSGKNLGKRFTATTDLAGGGPGLGRHVHRGGNAVRRRRIDLTYVRQVSRRSDRRCGTRPATTLVVVKSTVVPGTTDSVVRPLLEEASGGRAGADFGVGMNPEFLTEGQAIADFMNPDRIVTRRRWMPAPWRCWTPSTHPSRGSRGSGPTPAPRR